MIKSHKFDRFQAERALIKLNFTPTQRKGLLVAIEANPQLLLVLTEFGHILSNQTCGLSSTQITKIACDVNGLANIKAFAKYYPTLKNAGFNFFRIIKIMNKFEPFEIFPVIVEALPFFRREDISCNQILLLCELAGDIDRFLILKIHLKNLLKLSISKENIHFLLENQLLDHFISFVNQTPHSSITNATLKTYVSDSISVEQMALFFQNAIRLRKLKLADNDSFVLCSHDHAIDLISLAQRVFPKLIENHFNPQSLFRILVAENPHKNLEMLEKIGPQLLTFKYKQNELINLVQHPDGYRRLEKLYSRYLEYRSLGYTPVKILTKVMAEIRNKEEEMLEDDLSIYLREIDRMRELESSNDAKLAFISLFSAPSSLFSTPDFNESEILRLSTHV